MNLFRSLFGDPRLRPDWTYTPDGSVWRLLPSTSGLLVGEVRQEDARTVQFFCLRESDGKLQWPMRGLHEPWWLGIEAVVDDVLLIHGYTKPDLPEHRGLYAMSLKNGELLWQAPDLTYWFAISGSVYAVKTESDREVGVELDVQSGSIHREFEDPFHELLHLKEGQLLPSDGLLFPQPFDDGKIPDVVTRHVETIRKQYDIVGEPEGALFRERVIFVLHTRNPIVPGTVPTLTNRLFIIDDRKDRVIHTDVVESATHFPVPDSFFMKGDRLFYVKDGRTLVALSV